jgi:exodeoxyribonuclease-3
MRVVSWNVNSINARYDRFLNWMEHNQPDIVCLQELKTEGDAFPHDELAQMGYWAEIHGQKSYNGVDMDDGVADDQARLISGRVHGVHTICVYVPNGHNLQSDKWPYKLEWYARLRRWLAKHCDPHEPTVLCGDFNIAPQSIDIYDPSAWAEGVLCDPRGRAALQSIVDWGFVDTWRARFPGVQKFTWWDYRNLGFQKNNGLRIDMVYATPALAEMACDADIDMDERRGERPSDHAPIWTEFDWPC